MKKMLTFAAIAAVSTSAHAFDYKFGLEGRSDFISSTSKTEVGATTTKTKYMGFQSNLIRLSLTGNINENLTYKFRYRFNKTEATNTTRDNSTKSLDHLYVDTRTHFSQLVLVKQTGLKLTDVSLSFLQLIY